MKSSIVILHGWGLSAEKFLPLSKELQNRGYNVFVPDFPGFGSTSQPTQPLTLQDYATFLDRYLTKNKIVHPIFIAHSFGGRVALKYEYIHPKKVQALVLSGTPGFSPVNRNKLFLLIFFAKIGKMFWSLPLLNLLEERVRSFYYYLVGAKEFYRAKGPMRETFKNVVHEELVIPMKSVHIPCALIWGEQDAVVPLSIAKRMEATIPGAILRVIPDADHGVPYKQPAVFADNLEQFIQTL